VSSYEGDEPKIGAEIERITAALISESPLKSLETRATLAAVTARLVLHLRILSEREARGACAAEEGRTMPAVSSAILRNLRALHCTEAVLEQEGEEL
jgi:hypothetical protein